MLTVTNGKNIDRQAAPSKVGSRDCRADVMIGACPKGEAQRLAPKWNYFGESFRGDDFDKPKKLHKKTSARSLNPEPCTLNLEIMTETIVKAHDLSFKLLISSEEIGKRVREMGASLNTRFEGKAPLMVGILNGSFIFAADLIRQCRFDCPIQFVKLASYVGIQSSGTISTLMGLEQEIKGRDIIIVEDIIDSGKTMDYFIRFLNAKQPASITLVSLLVKPDALEYDFEIDHIGFNIANEFVIGYGLDYNELGRNLPGIYQLVKG